MGPTALDLPYRRIGGKGGALAPPCKGAWLEGPLGPEGKLLQGLKPRNYLTRLAAGLKPPSASHE